MDNPLLEIIDDNEDEAMDDDSLLESIVGLLRTHNHHAGMDIGFIPVDLPEAAAADDSEVSSVDDYEDSDSDDDEYPTCTMELSKQEHVWALEIKAAVEDHKSSLGHLTDFEYAQYALVTRGNLAEAIQRIQGVQLFQSHYNVKNTVEEGISVIQEYTILQPGALLNLDICPETGDGIMVMDLAPKFPAAPLSSTQKYTNIRDPDHKWKVTALSHYYMLQAVQPNFSAIRQGVVVLMDAAEVEWDNGEAMLSQSRQLYEEIWGHYPWVAQTKRVYNCNSVITVFVSLMKSFLSRDMYQSFVLGCDVGQEQDSIRPKITLRDLYLKPSRRFMLPRAMQLMNERIQNEKAFRL